MRSLKLFTLSILIAALGFAAKAQTPVELHITHMLNGSTFAFNTTAQNNLGNDFNVSRLEYYVSKISITHDGGSTTDIPDVYILANGSQDVVANLGSRNITNVESVSFYIGVDTPNNHADPSAQPNGHPLAPKFPSMHWGWTAGYRFVAMEGNSGTGLAQAYEIHALGDQNYFKVTVAVNPVTQGGKIIIPVNADYAAALRGIDVSSGVITHGDANEAATLLQNFRDYVFYPGHPVSVNNTQKSNVAVSIFPNPSTGNANIVLGTTDAADVQIVDVQGRIISTQHKAAGQNFVSINIAQAGLYFVKVTTADGTSNLQKLQVL